MAERLKEKFFTSESLSRFAEVFESIHPEFKREHFFELIYDETWAGRELKARMRHVTHCLHKVLPRSYPETLVLLREAAPRVKGFEAMSIPDYIELYGHKHWDLSMETLGYITRFASAEFAVRPYLLENPERAMGYMARWAEDPDPAVRRLASEGCRPRLPWAMTLPCFKDDPSLIVPVLEKLKNDPSDMVRRSVANNLNDISKDNPELMLDLCERWYGRLPETDAIIKHACRSLLKAGDKRALMLFGCDDAANISLDVLELEKETFVIGDDLRFSFQFTVTQDKEISIRLEYCIFYLKSSGKLSGKVFKISEGTFKPGKYIYSRKHTLADMTTRRHYPGTHELAIIFNGEEMARQSFELIR